MPQNAPYMCPAGGAKFGKDPKKMEPALVKFGGGAQTQESPISLNLRKKDKQKDFFSGQGFHLASQLNDCTLAHLNKITKV